MDPLCIQPSVPAADAAFWPALIFVIMESETADGCSNRSSHQGYFRLMYGLPVALSRESFIFIVRLWWHKTNAFPSVALWYTTWHEARTIYLQYTEVFWNESSHFLWNTPNYLWICMEKTHKWKWQILSKLYRLTRRTVPQTSNQVLHY